MNDANIKTTRRIKNKIKNKKLISTILAMTIIMITVAITSVEMKTSVNLYRDAIIIDGLSNDIPNPKLIDKTKLLLESAGFNVTVITADNLTINTYKWVLEAGFKIIIMRVHGAIIPDQDIVGLFANERYNESLYVKEREKGLVGVGRPYIDPSRELFVIGPKFIEKYGNLRGSIVIVFSCYSGYGDSLKKAFLNAGAKAYIGWDGPVDAITNDYAMEKLITGLFNHNFTIDQAITDTMNSVIFELKNKYVYSEPIPKLTYSPQNIGDLNVNDIINN
ncbi:MAG: hypothetical protein GSR85_04940 [Desulfurococcales archaeon]|nr:hypothetical protein [Desulfurococcales archaeon]